MNRRKFLRVEICSALIFVDANGLRSDILTKVASFNKEDAIKQMKENEKLKKLEAKKATDEKASQV